MRYEEDSGAGSHCEPQSPSVTPTPPSEIRVRNFQGISLSHPIRFWEMKKEQQLSLVTLFAQRTSAPSVNVAFRRTRRMGANGANATKMVSFLRTSGRTLRMACLASEARPICNPLNYSEERMAMTKCCGTTRSRSSPWISHFWIEV